MDGLSIASDLTSEKRAKKREQGLRTLFKATTQHAAGYNGQEAIRSQLDEIILPACKNSLRGGGSSTPAEQYAACRVLEATSILLGGGEDEFAEGLFTTLSRVIKVTSRAAQVRGAALRALSMAYFICMSGVDASDRVLDLCEQVCATEFRGEVVPPILRATALDCWALLSTTIHNAYLAGNDIPGSGDGRGLVILPLLNDCLNSSNLDLRCSAGECVALIHEARLDLGIDEDEGENASERRYRRGMFYYVDWLSSYHFLLKLISFLAALYYCFCIVGWLHRYINEHMHCFMFRVIFSLHDWLTTSFFTKKSIRILGWE